jgi:hypothetical protein
MGTGAMAIKTIPAQEITKVLLKPETKHPRTCTPGDTCEEGDDRKQRRRLPALKAGKLLEEQASERNKHPPAREKKFWML